MRVLRKKFLALVGGLFALGIAQTASAIIIASGSPGAGSTSLFDGVGTITFPTQPTFFPGTATLIDPWHVLTAAHMVNNIAVSDIKFTLDGTTYGVAKTAVAPGYVGGNPTGTTTRDFTTSDKNDIAVVTLASPVVGVTPWGYNHGTFTETSAGTAALVGYGVGGDGTNGENSTSFPFGTKRLGNNTISLVTTAPGGTTVTEPNGNHDIIPPSLLVWDFNKNDGSTGPLGDTAVGPTEGDISSGDSGGPVFQINPSTGQYVITGVSIDGTNNTSFGEISWATQTSAFSSFIATNTPEPTSLALAILTGTTLLARRRSKRRV